jgi:hypothetical protein
VMLQERKTGRYVNRGNGQKQIPRFARDDKNAKRREIPHICSE